MFLDFFRFLILSFFRFWRDSSARGRAAEEGCGRYCQEFSFKIQFLVSLLQVNLKFGCKLSFLFSGISMRLWFWRRRQAGETATASKEGRWGRSLTKEIHFFCKRNPFPSRKKSSLFSREIDFSQRRNLLGRKQGMKSGQCWPQYLLYPVLWQT